MPYCVVPTQADDLIPWRERHRQVMACQIMRDSWFTRGWTKPYFCMVDDQAVGYGLVGGSREEPRDKVIEFFLLPEHQGVALVLFQLLIDISGAKTVDAQTNDRLLTLMLYDTARRIKSQVILFADGLTTKLPAPNAQFRELAANDSVFPHRSEPPGDWVLERDGIIVATGGYFCHYNPPYADLYMEVAPEYRRQGLGSYLIQELKRLAYEAGKLPAARCNVKNVASRATLQKAGMLPCARLLTGSVAGAER